VTGIDELVRETLTADAETHHATGDLAARSIATGRRIRRRRQAGIATVSLASVAMIVGGSLAIAGVTGHDSRNTDSISVGHHGGGKPNGGTVSKPAAKPWWKSWSTDRAYGDPPSPAFVTAATSGGPATVYASGTMPDGTEFVAYTVNGDRHHVAEYTQGWNNSPDFGQAAGEGPTAGATAQYLTVESPTAVSGGESGHGTSQWLIVVGRPGTTRASYSADGKTWQATDVQDGIAVLRLPSQAPPTAQIKLGDDIGEYVVGPLVLP